MFCDSVIIHVSGFGQNGNTVRRMDLEVALGTRTNVGMREALNYQVVSLICYVGVSLI